MCEVARDEKHHLRKSTDRKAQIRRSERNERLTHFALQSIDFLAGSVYDLQQPHAHSLFLFPIVFGLDSFFSMGRRAPLQPFDRLSSEIQPLVASFERGLTKRAIFWQPKCTLNSLPISAPQWYRQPIESGARETKHGTIEV